MLYIAIALSSKETVVSWGDGGKGIPNFEVRSYKTLYDAMIDRDWLAKPYQIRLLIKQQPNGTFKPFRYQTANQSPGSYTWHKLDHEDPESGYLYGSNLSEDQKQQLEQLAEKQRKVYEEWEAERRREVFDADDKVI